MPGCRKLQEGADADIVVCDAGTISDHSTFEKPMESTVGVRYLLVGGTVVIDKGKTVSDVLPVRCWPRQNPKTSYALRQRYANAPVLNSIACRAATFGLKAAAYVEKSDSLLAKLDDNCATLLQIDPTFGVITGGTPHVRGRVTCEGHGQK